MAALETSALLGGDFVASASSVLNRNAAAHGPKFAIDGSDDTCWSSDKGAAQWIQVAAASATTPPLSAHTLLLQFQGGFVGQRGRVLASRWRSDRDAAEAGDGATAAAGAAASDVPAGWTLCGAFEPEDANTMQRFPVAIEGALRVRVAWEGSSDMFGRVTLYRLDLLR
jgi:hypothetical protein